MAACRHPCVVELLDVLVPPSPIGLVLELMVGGSLATAMAHPLWLSAVSQQQKLGILKGITRGLAWMHSKRFVHRDVKPHNIMLGPRALPMILEEAAGIKRTASGSWMAVEDSEGEGEGEGDPSAPLLLQAYGRADKTYLAANASQQMGWVLDDKSFLEETNESYMLPENWIVAKIGDLGTAVELPPDEPSDDGTRPGLVSGVVGTTGYVAPEVLQEEPYGTAADVFSYSIVAHELFAAEPQLANPLVGATGANFPQARPTLGAAHPPLVSAVCKKAWQLEPALRPTMAALCGVFKISD